MNKNTIFKLNDVSKELKKRNLLPLANYNKGKIIHQKQLEFHKSLKRNKWPLK